MATFADVEIGHHVWSGPAAAFEPSTLENGTLAWVDDGRFGIIRDGALLEPPLRDYDSDDSDGTSTTSTSTPEHVYLDADGNLVGEVGDGGHQVRLESEAAGRNVRDLIVEGHDVFQGFRLIDGYLHDRVGGLPGLESHYFNDSNYGVFLRPPDGGHAGITWDRSDGSKEWGLIAESGQRYGDQRATLHALRELELEAPIRGGSKLEHNRQTKGVVSDESDWTGEWTASGDGSATISAGVTPSKETYAGGGIEFGTSGGPFEYDRGGTYAFHLGHAFELEIELEARNDETQLRFEAGVRGPNQRAAFAVDAGGSRSNWKSLTDDGSSVEQSDTGVWFGSVAQYILRIWRPTPDDPVRFGIDNRGNNYHPRRDRVLQVAAHNSSDPASRAEPYFKLVSKDGQSKRVRVDYHRVECDRTP